MMLGKAIGLFIKGFYKLPLVYITSKVKIGMVQRFS
jgi:hypothetical protein